MAEGASVCAEAEKGPAERRARTEPNNQRVAVSCFRIVRFQLSAAPQRVRSNPQPVASAADHVKVFCVVETSWL